jgi:hypothetical protein
LEGSGAEEPGLEGSGVEEPGLEGSGIGEPGLADSDAEEPGLEGSGVEEPGVAGSGVEEPGLADSDVEEPEFFVSFVDELIYGARNCSHPAITKTEKSTAKTTKGINKLFVNTELKPLFFFKTVSKTDDWKSETIPQTCLWILFYANNRFLKLVLNHYYNNNKKE